MRDQRTKERDLVCEALVESLASTLTGRPARGLEEARLPGGSAWLSFVPIDALNLSLDRATFRDAIALRFGTMPPDPIARVAGVKSPFRMPSNAGSKTGW